MTATDSLHYDPSAPWNVGVNGSEALPLINDDAPIIRTEAGPGTGKTFGLRRRVLRLMHPQGARTSGEKVVVVAFNRVIAKELQKGIEATLKEASVNDAPVIQTVHGFCLRVLGEDLRMLLPHEREAMLYDVLHELPDLRTLYGDYEHTEQALHNHEARLGNHLKLWQAVRRWLVRHKACLISDLPGMLTDRIQGGDFADTQFEHILVDEFQDLTPAEQDLFFILRPPSGQLVAVGDRRQSIYAFLGNDRLGLAKLDVHAKKAGIPIQDVPMTECQRCPKEIVTAANQLMSLSGAKPLKPVNNVRARVLVVTWKNPNAEANGMAKLIADNIKAFPAEKHLVMVTRREFGYWLRNEIKQLDGAITVDLCFSESILEVWPVREAFLFFCLLTDADAPTWRAWLGYRTPEGENNHNAPQRNAGAYLQFLNACKDAITFEALLSLCSESRTARRGAGGTALWDRADRYRQLRAERSWAELDAGELIETVFDVGQWAKLGSPDLETAMNDFKHLRATALDLLEEANSSKQGQDRGDSLRAVARQLRYNIATRKPFATDDESNLKVTTLWGAKGLTANHVYVLGLCKEAMPGIRRESYPGTDREYFEEQQRLFYVSITRSKGTLVLSRALGIRKGDAKHLNLHTNQDWHWMNLEMCPFLRDIGELLPKAVSGETLLKDKPGFLLKDL